MCSFQANQVLFFLSSVRIGQTSMTKSENETEPFYCHSKRTKSIKTNLVEVIANETLISTLLCQIGNAWVTEREKKRVWWRGN